MTTATRPLVEYALGYADAGLEVFPVNPANKTPLVSQYTATFHADQITEWWTKWPNALIGHRIAPGMALLDVDPRHGGDTTWKALRAEAAELGQEWPETRAHRSGRGDNGGHTWWTVPPGAKLNIRGLTDWAAQRHVGENVGGGRWSPGIDLLTRDHRYTILPPSPHPDTGDPYQWVEARGLELAPAPFPDLLANLLSVRETAPESNRTFRPVAFELPDDSIADRYTATARWGDILYPAGWTLVRGDGDSDGSEWRHPRATSPVSATIAHGCLFVYSPNTPFEPTAPGDPHGYTRFRAYAILEHGGDLSAAARYQRLTIGAPMGLVRPAGDPYGYLQPDGLAGPYNGLQGAEIDRPAGPIPIDWAEFWAREHVGEDWLVHPLLPRGRQVAIWATHKTGKSLITLEVAAALATGRPVLTQTAGPPVDVIYLDLEMTEDDLYERLEDLGYSAPDNLEHLHYYLLPALPPLDTAPGGALLNNLATYHGAKAVILDTMARVVAGDENDADTYRNFYRCTGLGLKAQGVSVLRLDHGGKDPTKGQRGSSGKGDDVDVVWQLRKVDGGLELKLDVSRVSWVPDRITLLRSKDPLRHTVTSGGGWPDGTAEAAAALMNAGITSKDSQRRALDVAKELGIPGTRRVLTAAHRYLAELEQRTVDDLLADILGPETPPTDSDDNDR